MNEILELFTNSSEKNSLSAKRIKSDLQTDLAKEFGDIKDWTSVQLRDVIIATGIYKMHGFAERLYHYNLFYNWLIDEGYRTDNPVASSTFEYTPLMMRILKSGNVVYYHSKDINKAVENFYNKEYYLSIAYSIYEGVAKDINSLTKIQYSDIDFENKRCLCNNIPISDELLRYYNLMYESKFYETDRYDLLYYDDGSLIRRVVFPKKVPATTRTSMGVAIRKRLCEIDLRADSLYDSGLLFRLYKRIGLDKFENLFLNTENLNTTERGDFFKEIEPILKELGYKSNMQTFIYDYRVYAVAVHEKLITIE